MRAFWNTPSPDAEIVESTTIPLEGVRELYERAVDEDLRVARVHSGDPSLYGAVMEQIELCEEIGLEWEIVPASPLSGPRLRPSGAS